MGMRYRKYLAGPRIYGCSKCRTHLATINSMLSRVCRAVLPYPHCHKQHVLTYTPLPRHSTGNTGGPICLMECMYFFAFVSCSVSPHGLCHTYEPISVNVTEGEPSERTMTTGNHTVRDIFCVKCGTTLGWKYVRIHSSP